MKKLFFIAFGVVFSVNLFFATLFIVKPVYEIVLNDVTISWDRISEQSKHFSIEHFENMDVDDAFIISKNLHTYNEGIFDMQWYTIDVELFKNVDEYWMRFQIGH